ncbi:MAG: nuclear transport factor 2 family protein [Bryobacteraceae bacterium]
MITKKQASRILLLSAAVLSASAQTHSPQEAEIRSILSRQQTAWNRGDTEGFLQGYAPNTTFVGDKITRGLEEVRVRYQTHYPTLASMGHLTFSDIEIHMMGADYAYVLGRWRLERTAEAGGDTGGIYSLIFQRTAKGWRIILDHTT